MLRQFTPDICGILIDQVAGLTFGTRSRNHVFLTVMTFLNSFVLARGFGVFHSDGSFAHSTRYGACNTKSSIGHSTGYGVCNINVSFVLPNG